MPPSAPTRSLLNYSVFIKMGKLKGQNESVLIISAVGPSKMFLNEMAPRASMEVDHAQKGLLREAPCASYFLGVS